MKRVGLFTSVVACVVLIGACGSTTDNGGDGSSTAGSVPTEVQVVYDQAILEPTEIVQRTVGLEPFEPKPGGFIFNIACDQSITACSNNGNYVKAGAEAIGYDYKLCDAGPTPGGADRCFQIAINAKPSVIVTTSVPISSGADGYAQAKEQGIPVVGMYSGDPGDGQLTNSQIGVGGCGEQGKMLAAAIAVDSGADANVLFVTENSFQCVTERETEFKKTFETACPDCELDLLQFNVATMQQSLPQQIAGALNANPDIDWIVGAFDAVSSIAVTQVQQAGKTNDISVAGFDLNPPNVQLMQDGEVQRYDVGFDFGASGWGTVDIAARIYSGQNVPAGFPANNWMVSQETAGELGEAKLWEGPPNYEDQFLELWGKK